MLIQEREGVAVMWEGIQEGFPSVSENTLKGESKGDLLKLMERLSHEKGEGEGKGNRIIQNN